MSGRSVAVLVRLAELPRLFSFSRHLPKKSDVG